MVENQSHMHLLLYKKEPFLSLIMKKIFFSSKSPILSFYTIFTNYKKGGGQE
jgi:hypothetical protein